MRLWGRSRRQAETAVLDLAIREMRAQLDQQLQSVDGHDTKALGLLAANLVGVGFAFLLARTWTWYWVPPILAAVISCGSYLWAVRNVEFKTGPVVERYYEEFGAAELWVAQRGLLAELKAAWEYNKSLLPERAWAFRVGTGALIAEVAMGTAVLIALQLSWVK